MRIKENKGMVGTDVSIAIIILVLFVAIITTIFYQIGMSNKATTRQAMATNYAVNILEQIALMPYEGENGFKNATEEELTNIAKQYITKGYEVTVTKAKNNVDKVDLLQEVTVKITYPLGNQTKELQIKTLKTR